MKIKKFGSATILIETSDTKILCDPWLTDGAYYGAWCNFPPINLDDCDFSDVDYVYVSHVHPDHFDPNTIALLDKSTPILIHKYHQKFLKFNIERLGFKAIELENGKPTQLLGNTKISIYAADDCDPSICGHMFGCVTSEIKGSMQLDSLCIIDDGKHILVNTNDCPFGIAQKTLARIKDDYPKIDFALIGYTSASLYPHSMLDYSDKQMKKGIETAKMKGLLTGLDTLKILKPEHYLPFAGTYILGGSNYLKNKYLPIPELKDAVEFFQLELGKADINISPVLLNFNEFFDLKTREQSAKYTPINIKDRDKYINEIASSFMYDYEVDEIPKKDELLNLFSDALERLAKKQKELNLFEDMNLLFDLQNDEFACINLKDTTLTTINDISIINNYHRFQLDARLLKRVLRGPRFANWNNIEIGALLNFARKPNEYRMDIHTLINALHI